MKIMNLLIVLLFLFDLGALSVQQHIVAPEKLPVMQLGNLFVNRPAEIKSMTVQEWNTYYTWLVLNDKTKYNIGKQGRYVCVNYTLDSIKAANRMGFNNLYCCAINNINGNNSSGHLTIAVYVTGKGRIYCNPRFDTIDNGKGGWQIIEPRNDWLWTNELVNDSYRESYIIVAPQGLIIRSWSKLGGLNCSFDPDYVVTAGTI